MGIDSRSRHRAKQKACSLGLIMNFGVLLLVTCIGIPRAGADLSTAVASVEQAALENARSPAVDHYDADADPHTCSIQECSNLMVQYNKLPTQVDGSKGYQGPNHGLGPMDVAATGQVGPFKQSVTEKVTLKAGKLQNTPLLNAEALNQTAADATRDDATLTAAVDEEEMARQTMLNAQEDNNAAIRLATEAKRTAEIEAEQAKLFAANIAQQRNESVAAANRLVARVKLCKCDVELKRLNSPTPPAGTMLGTAWDSQEMVDSTKSDVADLGDTEGDSIDAQGPQQSVTFEETLTN